MKKLLTMVLAIAGVMGGWAQEVSQVNVTHLSPDIPPDIPL